MARIVIDKSLDKMVAQLPGVEVAGMKVAAAIVQGAQGIATSEGVIASGDYINSIHVERFNGHAIAIADDWKSNWVEFGTHNVRTPEASTPAHAPLRRAAMALGLRLEVRT